MQAERIAEHWNRNANCLVPATWWVRDDDGCLRWWGETAEEAIAAAKE